MTLFYLKVFLFKKLDRKNDVVFEYEKDDRKAQLKYIVFKRKRIRVLYQKEFGPCWIISIFNAFILMDRISLEDYENDEIPIIFLIKKLAYILTETAFVTCRNMDNDIKMFYLNLFKNFHQWSKNGINVNCNFSS